MIYDRAWESLSDALERVMNANGCTEEQAQAVIGQAVADRAVKLQAQPNRRATTGNTSTAILEESAFDLPATIKPADLDWQKSRPWKPWLVKRGGDHLPGYWEIAWVKLSRSDVTRELCVRAASSQTTAPPASIARRGRSRPGYDSAKWALEKVYPGGVPEQSVLRNNKLCERVVQELKDQGRPQVKDDTILRAAGRRN